MSHFTNLVTLQKQKTHTLDEVDHRGGSRILCRWGRRPSRGRRQHTILSKFQKNCMKSRKFWAVGRGAPSPISDTGSVSDSCDILLRVIVCHSPEGREVILRPAPRPRRPCSEQPRSLWQNPVLLPRFLQHHHGSKSVVTCHCPTNLQNNKVFVSATNDMKN